MDFQMSDESDLSKFVELDQYLGYSFCKSEAPLLMDTTCFSYQHLLPHLIEQCNNCQQQQQNSRIRQLDQQASSCGTPINQYMISNNDSKNNINLSHRQLSTSSAVSLSSNAMNSLAHANLSSHASLTSPLLFIQSKDHLFQPLPTRVNKPAFSGTLLPPLAMMQKLLQHAR
ncbi:hypothetical protein HELRODRAFT_165079 [Helobdella robusta]|uniref:Uncharacterized protein n=1 Tax=Helobdella robusta TaxID=6412 RepID=T1EW95_HELRO|nr:hypothetical protein HELRODRAFT_165079 [Helobdella robusta]ESN92940.1 hypothetical protein HELRODRAFT_165079 [Helobdella robusta]